MKKWTLLWALTPLVLSSASAQTSIEFIPAVGYTFGFTTALNSSVNYPPTIGKLDGGINYGGAFQFNLDRRFAMEILYNRLGESAQLYDVHASPGAVPLYQTQAGINYLMGGMVISYPLSHAPVVMFFGFDLGASFITPSPNMISASNANFAMGLQAGANLYFSPRMGIRVSARLMGSPRPVSGYYFGNWGGDPSLFAFLAPGIVQAGFNLGLIIGLGKALPEYQKRERRRGRARRKAEFFSGPN